MKYNVGDRVRIVEKWNRNTNQSILGGMDKWLGMVMTIRHVDTQGGIYRMEEDKNDLKISSMGWGWNEACIAGLADESDDKQKIVITTDGKETLARLYNGKNVVESATAKCHPIDTFDFKEGAKIAMRRLMGEDKPAEQKKPEKKYAFNIGDRVEHRWFGKGTVICIALDGNFGVEFAKGIGHDCEGITLVAGTVGTKCTSHWCMANDLKLIKKESEFVPYLSNGTTRYGNIGEPTNYKDAIGRPLCVGDTVDLYNHKNTYKGEGPVSKNDIHGAFIMGIASSCNDKTGSTGDWKIIKKRSFGEVQDGEKVDGIEYVKTERKR